MFGGEMGGAPELESELGFESWLGGKGKDDISSK